MGIDIYKLHVPSFAHDNDIDTDGQQRSPPMINSMFSLDHRLSELRASEADLRRARQIRDAADPGNRPTRPVSGLTRKLPEAAAPLGFLSRLTAI
jgi:hypothetical protein